MANRYENGKIYLITVGGERYVGSTVKTLEARLSSHRVDSVEASTRRLYAAVDAAGGWGAVELTLLEAYPCSTVEELRWRERHWYDVLQPELNSNRPILTDAEQARYYTDYREANKDKLKTRRDANVVDRKAYDRERYVANAEAVREQRRLHYAANREAIRARRAAKKAGN